MAGIRVSEYDDDGMFEIPRIEFTFKDTPIELSAVEEVNSVAWESAISDGLQHAADRLGKYTDLDPENLRNDQVVDAVGDAVSLLVPDSVPLIVWSQVVELVAYAAVSHIVNDSERLTVNEIREIIRDIIDRFRRWRVID